MIPILVTTAKCNIPAINPIIGPCLPAIGAIVVENSIEIMMPVDDKSKPKYTAAMITPRTTGAQFFKCLPKAEKPTIVNIAARTGPLITPLNNVTNNTADSPIIPMFINVTP